MGLLGWLFGANRPNADVDVLTGTVSNMQRYQQFEQQRKNVGISHADIPSKQWVVTEEGTKDVEIGKPFDIFGNR